MKNFIVDFKFIDRANGENIYTPIARGLEFPDWFGENLDALWDMLTGWLELPCRIVFLSADKLRKDEREYFARMLKLLDEAKREEYDITYEVR